MSAQQIPAAPVDHSSVPPLRGGIVRGILVLTIIAVALIWVFNNADKISVTDHQKYSLQLLKLRQINTKVDTDIFSIRLELHRNYDVISGDVERIDELIKQLHTPPKFLFKDGTELLLKAIDELGAQQAKKRNHIEMFIRKNAILRNSTRYFPTAIRQITKQITDPGLRNELNTLGSSVMTYLVLSDDDLLSSILGHIEELQAQSTKFPSIAPAVKNALNHARVIVTGKQDVDATLREVTAIPTDTQIEKIIQQYDAGYANAADRSRDYRILLFVVALALALYLALLFARLGRATQALQTSNENLRQNIEDLHNAQSHLYLYATLFNSAAEGMVITDANSHVLAANPAFSEITGYDVKEIQQRPSLLHHDSSFFDNLLATLNRRGKWQGEVINRRKSGEEYPAWLSFTAVYDPDDKEKLTNYIGVFSDITERRDHENRIQHLSLHDALTNLPNRLLMQERLNEALSQAQRLENHIAVLFMNLDRFRNINDTLGSELGDALLRQVASRSAKLLRSDNTDTISRLGSDEFVFILSNIGQPQDAASIARKLLTSISRPYLLGGHDITITASIGIAISGSDGNTTAELLRNADAAMSRAKEDGRNNFRFYSADMNITTLGDLLLENQLRNAIKHNELELYYQPKIDARTGVLQGAEALLRWHHPEQGMIPPDRFIRLAEESGLIVPIGAWVLRTACRQIHDWRKAGLPIVPIAVNLSAQQFLQNDLPATVSESLEAASLEPGLLELELTESMLMRNAERTIAILSHLHQMGISLAIDDFGTGYSSLSYLRRFEVNVLKIDKSFVADIQGADSGGKIAIAVISLAHALSLKVVAEGVETDAQRLFLLDHGCDIFQGYLFSRPVPASDFAQKLAGLKNVTPEG